MLTSKQKRYLKSLGSVLDSVVQIGKAGINPSVVDGAEAVIAARELIKVRVLKNSPAEPREAIEMLSRTVQAELVQVIGRNGLLYRRNEEKPKIQLPE
ncbi:MAG: RNA-binding protein [Firmicutes bacterium]|nr:RNA-binding protein [Bacillota bacterium]